MGMAQLVFLRAEHPELALFMGLTWQADRRWTASEARSETGFRQHGLIRRSRGADC
jgi:hypothetical protein